MTGGPAMPSVVREFLNAESRQQMKESTNRRRADRRPLRDGAHPQARTPAPVSGRAKSRGFHVTTAGRRGDARAMRRKDTR
jgi:hypothetical protein